jgi:PEP-CTERM motif-containing protein
MTGSRFLPLIAVLLLAAPSAAFAGDFVPVPEPSSLLLLAAGVGGAALVKFRKRK